MRSIANSHSICVDRPVGVVSVVCRSLIAATVFTGTLAVGGGCQLMTDPFHDDYAGRPPIVTPSVEGARSSGVVPVLNDRGFDPVEAKMADGSVTHGPLLFEDGLDDNWVGEEEFAVTNDDIFQWLGWDARFALNLVGVGGSWLVTPPWIVMVSDGAPSRVVLGESYDARKQ